MFREVLPLRRASRELVRELGFLDHQPEPSGLSHPQCHALIELGERGPLSQNDLAAILRLDKSRVSRVVAEVLALGLVRKDKGSDARSRIVALTARGRTRLARIHADASARVEIALTQLSADDRGAAVHGLELYAGALVQSRRRAAYSIRPVKRPDRAGVGKLIRTVMSEFGASGPGYASSDPELLDMHASYNAHGTRAAYWVVVHGEPGRVVGGGGFAPLTGGDKQICELRKMYLYSELRGLGIGAELVAMCINGATKAGFRVMYLETMHKMTRAHALYERHGFRRIAGPKGETGHHGAEVFYERALG
jgi:putative acetyltransferase